MSKERRGHRDRGRIDRAAAERAVKNLLTAMGYVPGEGDLAETPQLVAKAWCDELLDGEDVDVDEELRRGAVATARADREALVTLRNLSVTMLCPHHLMPAHGHGTVIYLPGERVVGLGTIARGLRALSRRLTLQERVGTYLSQALVESIGARGALCELRMTHTCLLARGAREVEAKVETLALAGSFLEPGPERDLALSTLSRSSR
ncbi:MAG: GTP cyclohydrolase I [Myxococcota bacterium]